MTDIPIHYYDNCPICGKELLDFDDIIMIEIEINVLSLYCSNGCYKIFEHNNNKNIFSIEIFDDRIEFYPSDYSSGEDVQTLGKKVREKIAYWRENDRYLMKMLEEK